MIRHLARALIGAAFVQQGIEQLRHPEAVAEAARPVVGRLAAQVPLPDDPVLLTRVGGAALVVGGLGLVTDSAPRVSAGLVTLAATPVIALRHPVADLRWSVLNGPEGTRLLADLGLLGGAVIAALDGTDATRTARRARRSSSRAAKGVRRLGRRAKREARLEAKEVQLQLRQARMAAEQARRSATHAVRQGAERVGGQISDAIPGAR